MTERDLYVSEIFGPTIQGEGERAGQAAMFLRLGGCNLTCTWCDTAYTWDFRRYDKSAIRRMENPAIVAALECSPVRRLVVTGGEPTLQDRALAPLLRDLLDRGWRIEMETNGTRMLAFNADLLQAVAFTVSPKLSHAGNLPERAFKSAVLRAFDQQGAAFKFVVQHSAQLLEVAAMVGACGIRPERVWIMAEGTTEETVRQRMRELVDSVTRSGWNLSPRLQVSLWGNERGR